MRNHSRWERIRRLHLLRAVATLVAGVSLFPGLATADPYRDLFKAIELDDATEIRLLLLRGVSPNSPDPNLGPAIVYATRQKSGKAVAALLENPATDANALNRSGESALMFAAQYGDLTLAKRLVARGAEVNKPGWTALHYAAAAGRAEMVEFLLGESAYIDAGSENGTTPLMLAARENHKIVVRLLVREGADPSLRNDAGFGAAEYLARAGERSEAQWVRERAAEYLAKYGTKAAPVPARRP